MVEDAEYGEVNRGCSYDAEVVAEFEYHSHKNASALINPWMVAALSGAADDQRFPVA